MVPSFFESISNGNTVFRACLDADNYIYNSRYGLYEITTDSWYMVSRNCNANVYRHAEHGIIKLEVCG